MNKYDFRRDSSISANWILFAIVWCCCLIGLLIERSFAFSSPCFRKDISFFQSGRMMATKTAAVAAATTTTTTSSPVRIAVIGGGAAGLVAARVLQRDLNNTKTVTVTVLEKETELGGVWRYQEKSSSHPMYFGLRTNLPKEIMGFREFPWQDDDDDDAIDTISYMTHQQVLAYLHSYAKHFGLYSCLQLGSSVQQLTVLPKTVSALQPPSNQDDVWPQIRLDWKKKTSATNSQEQTADTHQQSQVFDAVCVCNGHYNLPFSPDIPGLKDYFHGQTLHSIAYDDPRDFAGQIVLCIGGRASGSDVARELVSIGGAKHVYLSDTSCMQTETQRNVTWVPKTVQVLPSGKIQFDNDCPITPSVDTIIFCTGYDYSFPFINKNSNCPLEASQRRVTPLYEQFWHALYPNIAFVGLPHSVVPFPLFELQMEAFAHQAQNWSLETPAERRLDRAKKDAVSGGWTKGRIPEDTHYLGSEQWDYCRLMAQHANKLDKAMEDFISTNQAIYDHSGSERKGAFPGAPDKYRETVYHRNFQDQSFKVVKSLAEGPELEETTENSQ